MKRHDSGEDKVLIKKTKQGNRGSFEKLIKKYQKNIYYLCRRMTGAHQYADDLSQETFIKAYFALSGFDENRDFFPWLRKIAVNTSLNYLKSSKKEIPVSPDSRIMAKTRETSARSRPSYKIQEEEIQDKFQSALNELPAEQKIIFILKAQEGQSYEDIAEFLKIPVGTVMSRLSRARRKLKSSLEPYITGGAQ